MAYSATGSVPETLPRDAADPLGQPDALTEDPGRLDARPEADPTLDPSPEEMLRDVREAAREVGTGTPAKIDEAIAASEAEVGAAATRDRILSGGLMAADGTALLDGLAQDQRAELARSYEGGIRERAAGPDVALTPEMRDLKALEETAVRPLIADHFQDPAAAMDRLKALDEAGQTALAEGDTRVLGETKDGASLGAKESRALAAFADEWDQQPEAAALIGASQDQEHARTLQADLDGTKGPGHDPETPARMNEQDPARQGMQDEMSLRDRMEYQIAYQATAVPQI